MKIYVISGGPGTGKSETIKKIGERGHNVIEEAARQIANNDERFIGKSINEINQQQFHDAIFALQVDQIEKLSPEDRIFFSDRGLGDTIAYYNVRELKLSEENLEYAKKFRYKKIFILDFLDFYEKDELRTEEKEEQEQIHKSIIDVYTQLGYEVIIVPFMSVEERVDFILNRTI